MAKYSMEIDNALIKNPPVYASGIYFASMAKKFGVDEDVIKNKCIKLKLINVRRKKRSKKRSKVGSNNGCTSTNKDISDICTK